MQVCKLSRNKSKFIFLEYNQVLTAVVFKSLFLSLLQHIKRAALRDYGAQSAEVLCEVGNCLFSVKST